MKSSTTLSVKEFYTEFSWNSSRILCNVKLLWVGKVNLSNFKQTFLLEFLLRIFKKVLTLEKFLWFSNYSLLITKREISQLHLVYIITNFVSSKN